MYGKEQAIELITEFLKGDEKAILLTGTHQYKKHKLVMALLNKYYKNARILFRVNGMDNITNEEFAGFAGVKKTPKSGEWIKVGNNYYTFDSLNRTIWNRCGNKFDFAILYPIDSAMRGKINNVLEDLTRHKDIGKLFLVSWTDNTSYDYAAISEYYDRHVIYDAEEEEPAYHKRVCDIINKKF
ncbi:MAG: hypothetical protein FIA99_09330 [Ruminiclostridium sp.]|nr:hypothetical protein [Ruminiclostridium sp.]